MVVQKDVIVTMVILTAMDWWGLNLNQIYRNCTKNSSECVDGWVDGREQKPV